MIHQAVLFALPVPSALLLLLLGLYHLTPLLELLPNLKLTSSLVVKLSTIIPHPRKNLPREFFNLPPRPEDASKSKIRTLADKMGCALGVRGKLMLILVGQALLSFGCGWAYLLIDSSTLLCLATTPLPSTILTLAIFASTPNDPEPWHLTRKSRVLSILTRGGGITHANLLSRIMPISLSIVALITVLISFLPIALLPCLSALVGTTVLLGCIGRARRGKQTGRVRLQSPPVMEKPRVEALKNDESWVSSPGNDSADRVSAFSYSPSNATVTPHRSRSTLHIHQNGTPDSWISSPTTTPATIPPWSYSPSNIATPSAAHTRSRSPSPSPTAVEPPPSARSVPESTYTMALSTPGSHLGGQGSVMGDYSPDPFHPMPRGFESLTSFPISPSQMATPSNMALSRTSLAGRVKDITFIPEQRESKTGSTWTLETYHTASTFITPVSSGRRTAPPPPVPFRVPLPPTPTASRSETLYEFSQKNSTEMLMGERDWVEVGFEGDVEDWGRNGRGIGVVAITGMLLCYALTVPILLRTTDITLGLFIASLLVPPPLLATTSYLLRYRIPKPAQPSTKPSPYRSLALVSNSQLSLPISISPKLTPPAERRHTMNDGIAKLLEPKPSVSNFGFARPLTVYGVSNRDANAEEAMRRTLARRSGDVWIEAGHAVEGGGLFARAAEMLKPVPAMRVLDSFPARGKSQAPVPEIAISSPSKSDHRVSALSATDTCEGDHTSPGGGGAEVSAEIQVAQYGRMSRSPMFFYGPGYDVDWLTAGILPGLVPNIKLGPEVRVAPRPLSMQSPSTSPKKQSQRDSAQSHGTSSSIDLNTTPMRNRHQSTLSLPTFSPDFTAYRRSVEQERDEIDNNEFEEGITSHDDHGIDLPPIPHNLSTVAEESERSGSFSPWSNPQFHSTPAANQSRSHSHSRAPSQFEDALSGEGEDEALAEEMEHVLKMDTPTRAEFVISPPASIYARSNSRASQRSDTTTATISTTADLPPSLKSALKLPKSNQAIPPMPINRFTSHPHPPPPSLTDGNGYDIPVSVTHQSAMPSMPATARLLAHPYPPVRLRRSNEDMARDQNSYITPLRTRSSQNQRDDQARDARDKGKAKQVALPMQDLGPIKLGAPPKTKRGNGVDGAQAARRDENGMSPKKRGNTSGRGVNGNRENVSPTRGVIRA